MMKHIPLGKSGLLVPSVALGCMRLGDVDEKEAEALLDTALELGCNFFDHADIYGQGACESRFAQAIHMSPSVREKIIFNSGVFLGNPKFQELNDVIGELAQKYGTTDTAVAAAWILRHPAKMQLVAGTTKPSRLKEICQAADLTLTREEWYRLYLAAGHMLP